MFRIVSRDGGEAAGRDAAPRRESRDLREARDAFVAHRAAAASRRQSVRGGKRGGTWTVSDFNIDRELAERESAYRRQVGLYARAIAAATVQRARGVLLKV